MDTRVVDGTGRFESWLTDLEDRYLTDLTPREVARALRALSSCYVERRGKLASGAPLDSAGKRAAFALFYSPLHFLVTREIVRALAGEAGGIASLVDLGCGIGAAGAAWAEAIGPGRLIGIDRNEWAVKGANRTYAAFGLRGRAVRADVERARLDATARQGILAAYTINELTERVRRSLAPRLLDAHARGDRVLIIEPIARAGRWWDEWADTFSRAGGRADEWRFAVPLPERQRSLARAAGLDPRELTARSLWL